MPGHLPSAGCTVLDEVIYRLPRERWQSHLAADGYPRLPDGRRQCGLGRRGCSDCSPVNQSSDPAGLWEQSVPRRRRLTLCNMAVSVAVYTYARRAWFSELNPDTITKILCNVF